VRYLSSVVFAIALGACGRVNFDRLADGGAGSGEGEAGSGSGSDSGNGSAGGDGGALPPLCANAIPVQLGVPALANTCAGMSDLLDGCAPPANTPEVVFAFTSPANGSYSFRARDAGTQTVTNDTARLDTACTGRNSCAFLSFTSVPAGQTVYWIVEARSGGCEDVEFDVF
jgi:hypothetical protein